MATKMRRKRHTYSCLNSSHGTLHRKRQTANGASQLDEGDEGENNKLQFFDAPNDIVTRRMPYEIPGIFHEAQGLGAKLTRGL